MISSSVLATSGAPTDITLPANTYYVDFNVYNSDVIFTLAYQILNLSVSGYYAYLGTLMFNNTPDTNEYYYVSILVWIAVGMETISSIYSVAVSVVHLLTW